jgi:hypothetical protein
MRGEADCAWLPAFAFRLRLVGDVVIAESYVAYEYRKKRIEKLRRQRNSPCIN